jgi:hypothetical protein
MVLLGKELRSMALAEIHVGPGAEEELAALELDFQTIHRVLEMGHARRVECSPASAPYFAGMAMHDTIGVALRQVLKPKGWTWRNTMQMQVTNHALGVTLVHSTGNDATGVADASAVPTPAHPKGRMTADAVATNMALTLFGAAEEESQGFEMLKGLQTWMLLYRYEGDNILSEVSRPVDFDLVGGRVMEMSKRIIVPVYQTGKSININETDRPDEGFDFEIRRRA